MRISYPLFEFKIQAMTAVAATIIMVVILSANITVTSAQQQQGQQQLSTSQPTTASASQNATIARPTLFESAKDSFRVQLPEGWVIQDINNTSFTLAAELQQGYGVLAQLCPVGEEGQQQSALTNVSSSNSSCQQQDQQEIIHIIRYPSLDTRLGITVDDISNTIPGDIFRYEREKLKEVGYRQIHIINSTLATININYTATEGAAAAEATIPARIVEMTYSTTSAPNEMRRGYLVITATNVTPPNPEAITGYSIFYEGRGSNTTEQVTTPSRNLLVPSSFKQVFDSFELVASEEAGQLILALTQQGVADEPNDQVEDGEENDEDGEGEEEEDGEE
jgi:hypothetical protein